MDRIDDLRADPAVATRHERIPIDGEGFERVRANVEREVREETGVVADVREPVAVLAETFVHDGDTASGHRVAFAADATTALADDPGLDGEGIADVGWFAALPDRVDQRWLIERGRERR